MPLVSKTLSYGTMHMSVAFAVAYALTGQWQIALGISLVEPVVQTFCYTLHEWLWARKGGKKAQYHAHGGHAGFYY